MAILFYSTRGTHGCFSNFSRHAVVIDGRSWPTTEHYFQAMKFPDDFDRQERIRLAKTPKDAKKIAWERGATIRPDWDTHRIEVMRVALLDKFTRHEQLTQILLDTGDEELVEHTTNDRYWGDGGDGSGENMLGKLLMEVRARIRESQAP